MPAPQGSREWFIARLGRATASEFHRVMGGPRAWQSYAKQLRFERTLLHKVAVGEQVELPAVVDVQAMAWGQHWEPMARAEFAWRRQVDVQTPEFRVHSKLPWVGCSLDAVFFDHASYQQGAEIKCLFRQDNHLRICAAGMPDDYKAQVQGEIWVYDFDGLWFVSFDPRRQGEQRYYEQWVPRDAGYVKQLDQRVREFLTFVESGEEIVPAVEPGEIPVLF